MNTLLWLPDESGREVMDNIFFELKENFPVNRLTKTDCVRAGRTFQECHTCAEEEEIVSTCAFENISKTNSECWKNISQKPTEK